MKIMYIISLLSSLITCCSSNIKKDQIADCDKSTMWGNTKICLPQIDEMIECYNEPKINDRASKYKYDGNTILAFYVPNNIYKSKDILENIDLDNFFQVFATDRTKDIKFNNDELGNVENALIKSIDAKKWDEILRTLEAKREDISLTKPVFIERYSKSINVKTVLFFNQYNVNNKNIYALTSVSLINLKDRLIWISYYKNYSGSKSIEEIKKISDQINQRFLEQNK